MKIYLLYFVLFVGLVSLFSCEKDESKLTLSATPVAPTLTPVSALVLKRLESTNPIVIAGTKADFGFQASVVYDLEADLAGNQFKNPIALASSVVDTFKFTVASLNTKLIATLPQDKLNSLELRVKATMKVSSSGTPVTVISTSSPVSITTYGPPTIELTTAGQLQTITSINNDSIYTGWIYTDGSAFTLKNRDDSKVYGGTVGALVVAGAGLTLPAGAYTLTVNLKTFKASSKDVTVGMIGDAINGWGDADDLRMTWNFTDNTWNAANVTVKAGGVKFRTVGGWSAVNVAYAPASKDLNNLYQSGTIPGKDSGNIDDLPAGNYNVKFWLKPTLKATFTKI